MSASPRIVSSTRPNATPETEAAALAAIYRLAIEKYERQAAGSGVENAPKESRVSGHLKAESVRGRLP